MAQGLFDELVIADTGSVDATPDIARSFGARVVEFPWVNDFAAARNAALDAATGDYAFWLDADDLVPPWTRAALPALFDRLRPDQPVALMMSCILLQPTGLDGPTVRTSAHIRLFPNRPDVRWRYSIHERVEPALERAGIPVVERRDIPILHTGYRERAAVRRKEQRNLACLMHALAQDPGDPYLLGMLARELIEAGDHEGVLRLLMPALAVKPVGPFAVEVYREIAGLVAVARSYLDAG
jgi:hypothetical protein